MIVEGLTNKNSCCKICLTDPATPMDAFLHLRATRRDFYLWRDISYAPVS